MRSFSEEDLESEVWEDLIDFEEYCQVSTLGRFKRKKRGSLKELIFTLGYYSNGYEQFSIRINGQRYTAIAHVLVAKQFIPNPENKPLVNHKNGIRDDNRKNNLEWNTQSENILHAYRELGMKPRDSKGTKNVKAVLTEEQVLEIKNLYSNQNISISEISLLFNVKEPAIWKIVNNINWTHIGEFVYKKETTGYKYVTYLSTKNRWIANIYTSEGRKYLGRHKTEIEAAEAVKKYFNSETFILN